MKLVMRRRGRAAMIASAAVMAAFMRAMSASALALKARNSADPGLAALRLPNGAPGFAFAPPGKPTLPVPLARRERAR
jgi:hypothetical protein